MKKATKLLLLVVGIYVGLMLVSGLVIKAMLSGSRINALLSTAQSRLPVTVSAGQGTFSLAQWFLFRPVVTIERLSVGNPPGFSSDPMLEAREVSAQVALLSLFGDRFEILRIHLREPVARIETDAKGNTNAQLLLAALAGGAQPTEGAESSAGGLSIDTLSITSGTILYIGSTPAAGFAIRDLGLTVANFAADKTASLALRGRLFEGPASRFDFEGRVGPASAASLPAQGNLSVVLAPAEIPQATRDKYLGDLVRDPAAASRASFAAVMQGDLAKTLQGEGKIELADFQLGQSSANRIEMRGQAPFAITIRRLLQSPSFELRTQNATLDLGEGQWKGSLEAAFDGSRIQGESRGAISGVRINEMLGAFTSAKDSVFGLAEIPDYRIRFAGADAGQLRNSLAGQGRIEIKEGRIALFDLLDTVQSKIKQMTSGEAAQPGTTQFLRFASRFEIADGRVVMPDLVLESTSSNVTGNGYFGFDHSLNFDLDTAMAGNLAARLGGKPDSSGQPRLTVPVKVRGSVESPKVYPDVAGMAKEKAVEKAKGLFESFIKRRQK